MLISGVYLADSSNSEEYQFKNGNNIPCKIDHCIYAVKQKLSEEKNFTVRESNHFLETLMLLKKRPHNEGNKDYTKLRRS